MSLLEKVASPDLPNDDAIRANLRHVGLLVVAFSLLSCVHGFFLLQPDFAQYSPNVTPLQLLVGALLPQLLMVVGGIAMIIGEPRGKQLVVLALPLLFLYALVDISRSPYFFFAIPGLAFMIGLLSLVYWVVATSRTGTDPDRRRRVRSSVLVVLGLAVLLQYASMVSGDIEVIRRLAIHLAVSAA